MTSKNTALFIVTVVEVSNLTKVHFGNTVQSSAYVDDGNQKLRGAGTDSMFSVSCSIIMTVSILEF
jgi:hypothetical protein